jgi:hypothetical protein
MDTEVPGANIQPTTTIIVCLPTWLEEVRSRDLNNVLQKCTKAARKAWDNEMDTIERTYIAAKRTKSEGQTTIDDYV